LEVDVIYTFQNQHEFYTFRADTLADALARAEQETPLKRGWTGTWQHIRGHGWLYLVRNSNGVALTNKGEGCRIIPSIPGWAKGIPEQRHHT
jgi:hypothetical protein